MGDSRRFLLTAEFIRSHFAPCRVADVAGGTGMLSYYLTLWGFDCTVIEPCISDFAKDARQDVSRKLLHIARIREKFTPELAALHSFDLLVGLHPDQATEPLCHAAISSPAVIIPCCKFWQGVESHGSPSMLETCRRFLRKNNVAFWETTINMNGCKNVIISLGRAA